MAVGADAQGAAAEDEDAGETKTTTLVATTPSSRGITRTSKEQPSTSPRRWTQTSATMCSSGCADGHKRICPLTVIPKGDDAHLCSSLHRLCRCAHLHTISADHVHLYLSPGSPTCSSPPRRRFHWSVWGSCSPFGDGAIGKLCSLLRLSFGLSGRWRKTLGKISDTAFSSPTASAWWPKQEHEPLTIGFVCPLSICSPWKIWRMEGTTLWEEELCGLLKGDPGRLRDHLRKLWQILLPTRSPVPTTSPPSHA